MSTSPISVEREQYTQHPASLSWLAGGEHPKIGVLEREANKAAINAWLDANNLGPPLDRLGVWTEKEDEIVTILRAVDHGWVTVVTYATVRGDGTRGTQMAFYNANSKNGNGSVLIPAINIHVGRRWAATKYLFEREWRPTIGRHLVGCLRGFAVPVEASALRDAIKNDNLAALPLGADELRVCEVIAGFAKIVEEPVSIGPFYENSGLYAGSINVYTFAARVDNDPEWGCSLDAEAELMRRLRKIEPPGKRYLLWGIEQLIDELFERYGYKGTDGATAAALYLADHFYLRNGKRNIPILR